MFISSARNALSKRTFSASALQNADFTHAVIGGGVVGLAIARRLQDRDGASTVIIERHGMVGTETSSRNSEVIHAGLYYGLGSLKTRLCLRGKEMLYDFCNAHHVPHRRCGKWIVAQDSSQHEALESIHEFAKSAGVPTHFVLLDEGKRREPDVRAQSAILESPTTGIVDSHALMQALQGQFEERGGLCAFDSPVSRIEPVRGGMGGWKIWTTSKSDPTQETSITASTLINAAGLAAIPLSNKILPKSRHMKPHYAKGTYYSYSASRPRPSTLVYPAPRAGHAGLGTHLTLDLAGRVRFGPDVEWVSSPSDIEPTASPEKMAAALDDIETYLPGLDREAVAVDYAGIRPKLGRGSATAGGPGFVDFYIKKEEGFEGFVNLLGIESPGLTSALAIAEIVEELLYR